MPLSRKVGLGPGDIVLDTDPAPIPQKGAQPRNFRPLSVVAKWLDGSNCHFGTELGLGPGDIVLMGTQHPLKRRIVPTFWPMSIVATWLDGSRCHLVQR